MTRQTNRHQAATVDPMRSDMTARRPPRGVRIGDIVTMQSPDMGSISASDVGDLCRADQLQPPVQFPPNVRDCRFQIYPKLRYASRESMGRLRAAGGGRGVSRKTRSLEAAAQAEEELNVREFETHFGGEVRHGMVIQLLHLATGKFLTACGAIATIERDCHRISLTEGEEGSGWFIRPVFKFQQSGYPLLYNDDFYLESLGGKLGFLHISESPDDTVVKISSYVQQTFEVNCSQDKDQFRFCQYREGHVHKGKEASGCFFGDDIVTIHLWEHDSLLAAQLSRSGSASDLSRVCFLPACRGRRRADAMWKIEHQELWHAGDAVVFGKPFRLKHIASGLYMASKDLATYQRDDTTKNAGSGAAVPTVQGDVVQGDVYLTPYYYCPAGQTLWEFVAASDADTSIQSSSPLYLRSIGSHRWLHSLHVEGAPLKEEKARLVEERCPSHYMQLSLVDDAQDVQTVDRLRTFKCQFLDLAEDVSKVFKRQGQESDSWVELHTQLRVAQEGLGECIRLCVRDSTEEEEDLLLLAGEPCAKSQFLMYEVGVLWAVVYLIQCLSARSQKQDDDGEQESGIRSRFPPNVARVLQLGYWLIKSACAGCTDLKSFLTPWLGMFVEHVSLGMMDATDVLREIFTDNELLMTKGPQQEIRDFLDHLVAIYVQLRSHRCFRIFACMCTCEGAPIPFVQHFLTESLLQKHGDALPRLEGGRGTLHIAGDMLAGAEPFSPRSFNGREREVARSMLLSDTDGAPEMHAYCLMLCTLELFAALTSGRNRLVSAELQKPRWNLSRDVLLAVIKDSSFPSGFRRACLSVMQRLYIDIGDAKVVVAINHTYVWSETLRQLKAKATDDRSSKTTQRRSGNTWDLLRNTTQASKALQSNRLMECSQIETMIEELHSVFAEHVGILQEIIQLGLYWTSSITMTRIVSSACGESSEVLGLLRQHTEDLHLANALLLALHQMAEFGMLKLGDGKETKMVEAVTNNLIEFLALPINTRPMQHCKMSTCTLLQRIFAMRINVRLGKVFEAYEQQFGEGGAKGNEDAWLTIFQSLDAELFAHSGDACSIGPAFCDALLNLLTSDVELDCKSKCLELLFAATGERALLVKEAMGSTVLTHTESVIAYNRISEAVATFDQILPELADQDPGTALRAAATATAMVVSLSGLCMLTCDESGEGYSPEAVRKHQDLMHDLNVHRCILTMLKLPLRRKKVHNGLDEAEDQSRCALLKTCYAFIAVFVARNSQNQELIFPHIGQFMSHVGIQTIDAASAVAAVVHDNMLLVGQIRDVDLRVFVKAIAKHGKRPRWLHMLRDVLCVHGHWIRRNQSIVIGLLLEVPDLVLELDGDQEGAQQVSPCAPPPVIPSSLAAPPSLQSTGSCAGPEWSAAMLVRAASEAPVLDRAVLMREGNMTRLDLMIARDQDNGLSSFLCYHTSCVELLGFCCAGQNQMCQTKCRNLLSVRDAITAIVSCHHTNEGMPHPDVDADTLRLVRSAFLKFLYHCYAESAPHKLFDSVDNLWGGDSTALTGAMTQEVASLHATILQEDFDWRKSQEHLDFVFVTVLPFYAALLRGFAPEPMPPAIHDFVHTVADCCDALEGHWQAQHLDALENFFSSLPDIDGMEDTTDHIIEAIEDWRTQLSWRSKAEQLRVNPQEAIADEFCKGFPRFVQSLSWAIGVDPAQVLGSGLKATVRNIASRGKVMQHLALVITEEAGSTTPGRTPFLLNCIRAVRGYLCGIQNAREETAQASWDAFISHQQPSDEDLAERQEHVAAAGIIESLAEALSHTQDLVIREVLFTLQATLAVRNCIQPALGPHTTLLKYLSEEGQRRHFAASCAELFRRAVLGLQERERLVKRKQEQDNARKRAQDRQASRTPRGSLRHIDTRFLEENGMEAEGSRVQRSCSMMSEGTEEQGPDSPQSSGAAQAVSSLSGHPLELLTLLTTCLEGGCRSDFQDLLFVTGLENGLNKEDILGELVNFLQQSEKLVQFSAALGDDHLLLVAKQAFRFLRELIHGPNAAVVQVVINQTDIVEVTRNWLVALPYDGIFDSLKFDVKNNILMFTLTILQNCTPEMGYVSRKWLSQDCEKAFLDAWLVASGGLLPERGLSESSLAHAPRSAAVMFEAAVEAAAAESEQARKTLGHKLDEQAFLSFLVISYLADSSSAPTQLRGLVIASEAHETFSRQCARVEVRRNGSVYQLRFRVPAVCASLQAQERFASEVQQVVHECVDRADDEESRPALFQDRMVALIQRELRQSETQRSLLGLLVRHQNWVWRLPAFATLLINAWLLVFGPGRSSPEHAREGNVSGGSTGSEAADLVGVCTSIACSAVVNNSASGGTASKGPHGAALAAGAVALALFHNLCYVLRFVLVMGTSSVRHELLFETLLLLCSIAGSILSPFLFAVHVLEFFSAPSARMLLSAATLNAAKLGQAGLIILLTVYVYAIVGFRLFRERHVDGTCSTLLNCVLSYLDGGLTGSGIHNAINLETPQSLWSSSLADWVTQLFAMSFLTIFVQVLLAIFSGVIIDSFGALRDQHAEVTAHLSESSHLFSHGTYNQYVNLLVSLLHVSDPSLLTDLEKYVYCQVMADCSDWLPYRLDRHLQGDDTFGKSGRDTDALCERLDGLSDRVDDICLRMERIEGSSSETAARLVHFEQAMKDHWNSTNEQLKALHELLQRQK